MERIESAASASAARAGALDAEGSEEEIRLASLINCPENDAARCRARDSGGCSVWRTVEGATPKPAARRRPGRTETMIGRERARAREREREKEKKTLLLST